MKREDLNLWITRGSHDAQMDPGGGQYLDRIACNIFRDMTAEEARELLDTIKQNYDDWHMEEDITYRRGIHKLYNKYMKEASKSVKENDIKTSYLKKSLKRFLNFPSMNLVFLCKCML
jgi:hypothetical protein